MNIAIIPARSGSKRIPQKNIKIFIDKPIIAFAIDCAKKSNLFEHILVTTDDEKISHIAQDYGAEVPFLRPQTLADDITPTVPVIQHAILECLKLGWDISNVCSIYPATPFMQIDDLISGLRLLNGNPSKFIFPITEYPSPIQRALKLSRNGFIEPFYSEFVLTRTQDLEPSFFDVGQFYWAKKETWLKEKNIHLNGLGVNIPNWRAVDIDNFDDWKKAELIYKVSKEDKSLL